jgi:DNA replicative helicase MCM subunit Mcm2 (Cdc46/Mcm family)
MFVITRRGDINELLPDAPGSAECQLLEFVGKVSHIGVNTYGKRNSAAGLTA